MMLLLTVLKISYILASNLSPLLLQKPEDSDQLKEEVKKREEDEFFYSEHIINNLSDRLYDLYASVKFAKEI